MRTFQFIVVPVAILLWFIVTDPSNGADTLLRLQLFAQALLVTGFAYLISKATLGRASSQTLYEKAKNGNQAAAIAYLGICILRGLILFSLLYFFGTVNK